MELIYIYIDRFKNIERQGFTMSSRYRVNYDLERKVLEVKERDDFIPNFFGSGISNVTAIVGQNGSGKTNLLEFIAHHLSGSEESWKTKAIVIYRKAQYGELYIQANIDNLSYSKHSLNLAKSDRDVSPVCKTVYYSYLYDEEPKIFEQTPNDYLINISTNYRVSFTRDNELAYGGKYNRKLSYRSLEAKITAQLVDEYSMEFSHFNVRIPHEIAIYPYQDYARDLAKRSFQGDNKTTSQIDIIHQQLDDGTLYSKFRAAVFWSLLYEQSSRFVRDKFYSFLSDLTDKGDRIQDSELFSIPFQSDANPAIEFLNFISQRAIDNRGKDSFRLLIRNGDAKQFFQALSNLAIEISDPFHYEWYFTEQESPGVLSSGEKSLLSLLSRLVVVRDWALPGNIVILLDEADIAFHPQWQKAFLKYIINFLPRLLVGNGKEFHLILTAHSPFVISDLPRENILFLEKDAKGRCVKSDGTKHQRTFGANIHTLYTDTFFMQDGLIGEFAKAKIFELIKTIKSYSPDRDRDRFSRDEIRKTIDKVGEPIIREKLDQLYWKHVISEVQERRAWLQKQIDELDRKENGSSL